MSEALVIAMTRLGDLVQSEPFCRALNAAGAKRVTLLTEEAFIPIAEMLDGVDNVVSLRFADVLPQLGQAARDYPVASVNDLIESLRARNFSQVWNLTHTRPAMMLTAAIGGDATRGVTIDPQGRQVVRGGWLRYFFATNLARPWSVFNLVDVYVNSASREMPFEARIPRLKYQARQKTAPRVWSNLRVAIHPGASQRDKQWPVERFHAVVQTLLDRGVKIVLIGGKGDRELGRQFTPHPQLSNKIGETPIQELVDLLADVDMLVSADSGPVHIAAAVGTKVIAIEGGSAHGWETAPYGPGHWVLQPHLTNLLSRVPDKKVASAGAAAISVGCVMSVIEAAMNQRQSPVADEGCTIYETCADGNTLRLVPRAGAQEQIDEWYSSLRMMWSNVLQSGRDVLPKDDSAASRCASTARELSHVRESDYQRIEELASQLQAEQGQLMTRLLSEPPLHALARFLEISLAGVEGATLSQQAAETAEVFEQISRGLVPVSRKDNTRKLLIRDRNMQEDSCASI